MEKTFYAAAEDGKVEEVKDILRKNPSLNVNWRNEGEYARTALYPSCRCGHDSVVSILLAHPDIDPNLKDKLGDTPFMIVCCHGKTSCVRLLLQDQRVMVNEPDDHGLTPLFWAAHQGHQDVIEWCIVSGREIDLGTPGDGGTDAIGVAKQEKKTEVVNLLRRFKSDATKTRSEVRLELGINGQSNLLWVDVRRSSPNYSSIVQVSLCPPRQSSPWNSTSPLLPNPLKTFYPLLPGRWLSPSKKKIPSSPPLLPGKWWISLVLSNSFSN